MGVNYSFGRNYFQNLKYFAQVSPNISRNYPKLPKPKFENVSVDRLNETSFARNTIKYGINFFNLIVLTTFLFYRLLKYKLCIGQT